MIRTMLNKYEELLKSKGADLPCPRCNNSKFAVIEGYFNNRILQTLSTVSSVSSTSTVPSIVTVCSNCGYLSQHAYGILVESLENINKGKVYE
jgi:bacterioferritin-associated ferredoxin